MHNVSLSLSASTSLTITAHDKPAGRRGSLKKHTPINWKALTLQASLSLDIRVVQWATILFLLSSYFWILFFLVLQQHLYWNLFPVLWQSVAFLTNWSGLLALSSWPISFPCCRSPSSLFAFQWPLCLPLYCLILCLPCMNSNSMSTSAVLLPSSPRKKVKHKIRLASKRHWWCVMM